MERSVDSLGQQDMRILIEGIAFRIIPHMKMLIEDDNPYNVIHYEDLRKEVMFYKVKFDSIDRNISKDNQGKDLILPAPLLHSGYKEGSDFAAQFNNDIAGDCGFKLVDSLEAIKLESRPLSLIDDWQLPQIERYGRKFIIDVVNDEVYLKDDWAGNVLPFNRMAKEPGGGYSFDYDCANGIIATSSKIGASLVKVCLGEKVEMDPKRMCECYGLERSQLPKRDEDLPANPQFLEKRFNERAYPEVRINDRLYLVDFSQRELREVTDPNNVIRLDQGAELLYRRYGFLYDLRKHQQVPVKDKAADLTPDTRYVLLPDIIYIDPATAVDKINEYPQRIPERYRFKERIEARILPLKSIRLDRDLGIAIMNVRQKNLRKGRD
jgi:hypothetical protein